MTKQDRVRNRYQLAARYTSIYWFMYVRRTLDLDKSMPEETFLNALSELLNLWHGIPIEQFLKWESDKYSKGSRK